MAGPLGIPASAPHHRRALAMGGEAHFIATSHPPSSTRLKNTTSRTVPQRRAWDCSGCGRKSRMTTWTRMNTLVCTRRRRWLGRAGLEATAIPPSQIGQHQQMFGYPLEQGLHDQDLFTLYPLDMDMIKYDLIVQGNGGRPQQRLVELPLCPAPFRHAPDTKRSWLQGRSGITHISRGAWSS